MPAEKNHLKILHQFKELFRMIPRYFYDDQQIVIMDYIVKAYFDKQYFETNEISYETKLADRQVRSELISFEKAKLICMIREHQLRAPEYEHILKKQEELKSNGQNQQKKNQVDEYWELNRHIKEVIEDRIKLIERKMESEFKDYDCYTKQCDNSYCRAMWKSEEYF